MQYPKLIVSKTAANEVVNIEWNPRMDLLATVFCNGAVTCSRLLSLQRIWHRQPNGKIISVAWRPDGRVLAIGAYNEKTKQHVCSLHEVEKWQEINVITKDKPITSVTWFQYQPLESREPVIFQTESTADRESAAKSTEPDTKVTFSHKLAHQQSQLNILLISTDDGKISLYALGLFYLGDIAQLPLSPMKIVRAHMSSCLKYLSTITSNGNGSSIRVLKLDTFQERNQEILRVSTMYAKIIDELEYLDDTMKAITTSWTDVLAGLDNKLSSYGSRKNANPDDSDGGYTFLGADELLTLFLGPPFPDSRSSSNSNLSDNLEKFLADMSDKGLKKLNTAIEQTCLRVQNLIVKNAIKCCFHLQQDLNLLRGMSLWRERFADVGLDDNSTINAMKTVGSLVFKLAELQQVISHSLESAKVFFDWLISIACSINGEQANNSVPNDGKKTNQRKIKLIQDFITDNFDYNSDNDDFSLGDESAIKRPTCSNFTLEQVGQYLKNEPLSRLKHSFEKPGSNLWIDFYKRRVENIEDSYIDEDGSSVPIFYPHNAETSLIQEHKSTCRAINAAFESIAQNFKLGSDGSGQLIYLKDFLRNSPPERVKVETDGSMHYTLFPTKQGLATKHFLMIHSMQDKTFSLISMEFQAVDHHVQISDSSFYDNKVISFLVIDQTKNDTLIVQVEISKILKDIEVLSPRTQRDISKIFRSTDCIERASTQVVLQLDIETEPPKDRKHNPDMMVKKIKGTIGNSMFTGCGRKLIALTSFGNRRLHLYGLETLVKGSELTDDKMEGEEKIDESFIDTDLI